MGKQNEKLITNLNRLNEEEKTKQQEPKVYGQKPVKGRSDKEESTRLHDSSRV